MPNGTGDLTDLEKNWELVKMERLKKKTFCQNGTHKGQRHKRAPWEDKEETSLHRTKVCCCLYCGFKLQEEIFK